jgi:hypothetical protein
VTLLRGKATGSARSPKATASRSCGEAGSSITGATSRKAFAESRRTGATASYAGLRRVRLHRDAGGHAPLGGRLPTRGPHRSKRMLWGTRVSVWDVVWNVLVVAILAAVALLFIVAAVSQPTVWARVAAFVTIAAGIVAGLEVAAPWLPIGLIVAAVALWVTGRRSETRSVSRQAPHH